jgi:hypothetical protein
MVLNARVACTSSRCKARRPFGFAERMPARAAIMPRGIVALCQIQGCRVRNLARERQGRERHNEIGEVAICVVAIRSSKSNTPTKGRGLPGTAISPAPVRRRRAGPCVIERTKARALAGDGGQRVQEVAGRARQPVEARYHQHVAFSKLADDAAQLGAVGPRAACRFPKDLLGSGVTQLLHPRVEVLAVGRYPRVAVFHGSLHAR